jgi:hypothetical protein
MSTGDRIVAWVAFAVIVGAWARWVADGLDLTRPRPDPGSNVLLLHVPIGMAAIAVGVATVSWQNALGFAFFGFYLWPTASAVLDAVRARRRRRAQGIVRRA